VLHWCESLCERLLVALGGRRADAVACYSWSLSVPRRLGDCLREARKKDCAVLRS
jgi:hypothetical protein